ncbi:MAG: hypothetical protein IJU64_01665 [Bacilli bacterium]|nr:hypothetical protein [Bacilli bacterium]
MKISVKNSIYQAILHRKWLDISYLNRKGETTYYYIGIKGIDIKTGKVICDIFNPGKNNRVLEGRRNQDTFIFIDQIKTASVLSQSYYETPSSLMEKLNQKVFDEYLEVVNFDNNILRYLSDCYRLDNDPFISDSAMLDDVDCHRLEQEGKYQLNDRQFDTILDFVFRKSRREAEKINRFQTLAINRLSIDIDDKQYVVAYRVLTLDFKNRTLKSAGKTSINKSFLVSEGKKATIGMYLEMDPEEFVQSYDEHEEEYKQAIAENFNSGEIINTRPSIFLLARDPQNMGAIDDALEAIHQMDLDGKLTVPLKSFFGRNKSRSGTSKDVEIVVSDRNKINIDQMRVVYNAMMNHVTYVKGPPGTGKTETIFNVLLSAYANDKTVLVCSNNNHPVNDIFAKMDGSLTYRKPYSSEPEKILFPMIRLGNNDEMAEAIRKLRDIMAFVSKHEKSKVQEGLTAASKKRSLSHFRELKELLMEYEAQIDLQERLATLEKIRLLTKIDRINSKLDEQIAAYRKKVASAHPIQDKDVLEYAISASESKDFQNYVYYSALARLKRLANPPFKELREILDVEDMGEAVHLLNKYLKEDANLHRFLSVFPIVLCTNLSCYKLGSAKPQFDLVIMDEAGQCNTASSLIPIVRGNDLLLVGDTNQLQPVTVLEEPVNESLMRRNSVGEEYDYIHNSILSTMLRKDNNSKNILLRYHYRCGRRIASFVNQRFYDHQLKLLNSEEGSLVYLQTKNRPVPGKRNASLEEAMEVAKLIKENHYKNVGIITSFVNQCNLINDCLLKLGVTDTKAGTVHTLQGSEKDVIIMSAGLSVRTGKKTMDWIKNNHELINVAVTRAKKKLVFVGDKEAIDALSHGEENDIKVLSDYVHQNGKIVVPKSDAVIAYGFSNDSANEKAFFDTLQPYFNRRGSKFRIERNVPVIKAIKNVHSQDLRLIGKKEFDVIVQVSGGFLNRQYATIVVFEIDGGEHIGQKVTARLDRQKEEVCARYGIKMIRIPNSAVKDYESIISLFEFVVKDLKDIDEAYTQMSLFDED